MNKINFEKNSSEVHGRAVVNTRSFQNGEPGTFIPDRILMDSRFSGGMVRVAAWVWGQSLSWVFRVGDIQDRLGITEGEWRTLRKEMIEAGFMGQRKEITEDGSYRHCISFNFAIFQGCQQGSSSREVSKTTPHASKRKQPLTGAADGDNCNHRFIKPAFKKPPPIEMSGDGGGDIGPQKDADARKIAAQLGLAGDEVARFCKASGAASAEQLNLIPRIFDSTKCVNDRMGFCVDLAKKAARGLLAPPNGKSASSLMTSIADELAVLNDWANYVISGPEGVVAMVQEGRLRELKSNALLHPQATLELIRKVHSGELDAHPKQPSSLSVVG